MDRFFVFTHWICSIDRVKFHYSTIGIDIFNRNCNFAFIFTWSRVETNFNRLNNFFFEVVCSINHFTLSNYFQIIVHQDSNCRNYIVLSIYRNCTFVNETILIYCCIFTVCPIDKSIWSSTV